MITEIGIVAGEIWNHLDKNGSVNIDQLVEAINQPRELVLMSLGWLAREGHVTVGNAEEGYPAALTEQNA